MDAMLASDLAFVQFVAELGAASQKLLVVMNRITYPGCAGDGTGGMIDPWLVKRHRHETLNEGVVTVAGHPAQLFYAAWRRLLRRASLRVHRPCGRGYATGTLRR